MKLRDTRNLALGALPLEEEPGGEAVTQQLDRVWAKLGFEHFRHGIHVLDLNLTTLDENLAQLRKHAECYHTLRD